MIGRIMIASTMPAVRMVRPVAEAGPGEEREEAEVVVEPGVERARGAGRGTPMPQRP